MRHFSWHDRSRGRIKTASGKLKDGLNLLRRYMKLLDDFFDI